MLRIKKKHPRITWESDIDRLHCRCMFLVTSPDGISAGCEVHGQAPSCSLCADDCGPLPLDQIGHCPRERTEMEHAKEARCVISTHQTTAECGNITHGAAKENQTGGGYQEILPAPTPEMVEKAVNFMADLFEKCLWRQINKVA